MCRHCCTYYYDYYYLINAWRGKGAAVMQSLSIESDQLPNAVCVKAASRSYYGNHRAAGHHCDSNGHCSCRSMAVLGLPGLTDCSTGRRHVVLPYVLTYFVA